MLDKNLNSPNKKLFNNVTTLHVQHLRNPRASDPSSSKTLYLRRYYFSNVKNFCKGKMYLKFCLPSSLFYGKYANYIAWVVECTSLWEKTLPLYTCKINVQIITIIQLEYNNMYRVNIFRIYRQHLAVERWIAGWVFFFCNAIYLYTRIKCQQKPSIV